MAKTDDETKNATWFRAEIPDYVNEALKSMAKEKTRRYKKHGASYTKESVIIAILEIVAEAKKSGSLKSLASWLYDGEYTGNISEAPSGEGKISRFSSAGMRPIPAALNGNAKGKPAKRLASLPAV